ncbi:hypothetical protein CEXT_624581 [Caerostris extrusa]|uniref:Uncharacterized protein n=1 Tax=Caerostris extrusa TaxID=172846 RepID=A0AAV4YF46_CAEEX|nr:hypothetical protein CEXT_624581 [Caerostris extrusa]
MSLDKDIKSPPYLNRSENSTVKCVCSYDMKLHQKPYTFLSRAPIFVRSHVDTHYRSRSASAPPICPLSIIPLVRSQLNGIA